MGRHDDSEGVGLLAKKPFDMKQEDGRDKLKASLAKCLKFARVCESTTGKEIAQVTDAVPSPRGAVLHFTINPDDMPNRSRGLSIEIPAFALLGAGEVPIVPAESGVYEIVLSNGVTARANFIGSTKKWMVGNKEVGSFSDVHLENCRFPGVVIGITRVGDVPEEQTKNPDDSVNISAVAGEGLKASLTPIEDAGSPTG